MGQGLHGCAATTAAARREACPVFVRGGLHCPWTGLEDKVATRQELLAGRDPSEVLTRDGLLAGQVEACLDGADARCRIGPALAPEWMSEQAGADGEVRGSGHFAQSGNTPRPLPCFNPPPRMPS